MGRNRTNNAKQSRVGIYIMPDTRNRLNLLKVVWAIDDGQPLSQDETIRRLIDTFEKTKNGHNGSRVQNEMSYVPS